MQASSAPAPGLAAAEGDRTGSGLDQLVAELVRLGVTPNMVSVLGFVLSAGAAFCLAVGAGHAVPYDVVGAGARVSWWPTAAAVFIALSCTADLLDGTLARRASLESQFGALLDSTLDRFGDMLLFGACAYYYARLGDATYVLLAVAGLSFAVQISYVKARAENFAEGVGIGFWQRGERMATLFTGAVTGHMAVALWMLATFPLLTVARRLVAARHILAGQQPPPPRSVPWQQPRRALPYRAFCGLLILIILVVPWLFPGFRG